MFSYVHGLIMMSRYLRPFQHKITYFMFACLISVSDSLIAFLQSITEQYLNINV